MTASRVSPGLPERPVWFLDIDGTIGPYRDDGDVSDWTDFLYGHQRPSTMSVPFVREVIDGIQRLHEDGVLEVRWLTTWPSEAVDRWIAVGLGPFDVAEKARGTRRAWKANVVAAFLAANPDRRVIWCDDDAGRSLRDLRGPRLLVIAPNHEIGLTTDDIDLIEAWVRDPASVSHHRK